MINSKGRRTRQSIEQFHPQPYRLLLPLANLEEAKILLPLADIILQEYQGQLLILNVASVPEGTSLSVAAGQASRFREALSALLSERVNITAQIKTIARVAAEVWDGIWDVVAQEQINLLLLGWRSAAMAECAVSELNDFRLANPPCDVVAVHPSAHIRDIEGWQAARRILLPVRGGANSTLTLRIGHALAQQVNAAITLLHVTRRETRDDEAQFVDEFSPALHGLERISRSVTTKGDIPNEIVQEARDYQVVVMGAPSRNVHSDGWSGPLLDTVVAGTDTTLIVVKERRPPTNQTLVTDEPLTVQRDRPVAVVVDKWFAENTFHSREFADLERLVALKEEGQLVISLGLPALNEAETVGNVIQAVKSNLMEKFPLLDEIVLIDSGSVDYTREIAADLGIPVYIHQEILPQYGSYRGKGEALWKSMYVLNGDIIAWIDTDIKNIHPRFVYGVVGPLLRDQHIQYVKGFYRRPLREGDKLVAGSGGRVTELTARPFINLFFPELSGLIQPLSGEYAGRRQALERMPFFTGYGVETGLLIDLMDEFGLNAIAQVDLLERIHHNQPLPSLSKMSFTIMQVVFSRLEKLHNISLLEDATLTMNLIRFGPNRYYLETEEIREEERPPMITLPEYCQKRGLPEPAGQESGRHGLNGAQVDRWVE